MTQAHTETSTHTNKHKHTQNVYTHTHTIHGGELVTCRWGCTLLRVMVWAPRSPTWTTLISEHRQQFDIRFPSYYQAPIDVTAR